MAGFTRGFSGRQREESPELPPGQFLTHDFPVLSAGPTPRVDFDEWEFSITTESGDKHTWDWQAMQALAVDDVMTDIHCVTRWSKLGTSWRGVSLDTLFAEVETGYDYTMAHSYGGYTTNVPLDDLLDGKAWIAFEFDGEPLDPEHGGPARLLIPHLYFWKSAKWIRSIEMTAGDDPGFWEQNGYHLYGDPWQEQRYW